MTWRNYQIHPFQGFLVLWALISLSAAQTVVTPTNSTAASIGAPTVQNSTMKMNSTAMDNSTNKMPSPPPPITCKSFHCIGPHCYQNMSSYMTPTMNATMTPTMNATMNATMTPTMNGTMNSTMNPPIDTMNCDAGSYCELYNTNGSHYLTRCSSKCDVGNNRCMVNGTMKDWCTVDCCNTSMCLKLNQTAYFGEMPTTPAPTTTTTTTVATTVFTGNGKWCRTFTCDGRDCFKGKDSKMQCRSGSDYCELKKKFGSTVTFTAGCSSTCKTGSPSCSSATAGECYQECCDGAAQCCMKMDGSVHLNGASQLNQGSIIKLLVCAALVILSSRLSALQQI